MAARKSPNPPRRVLTPQQHRFLAWLVDPKREGSHQTIAVELGVTTATLHNWKKNPVFREEWQRHQDDLNVRPDRIQAVTEAVYTAACRGDVRAAELYLRYIDRFTPKSIVQSDTAPIADLSDEELAAELEENVVALRSTRKESA